MLNLGRKRLTLRGRMRRTFWSALYGVFLIV